MNIPNRFRSAVESHLVRLDHRAGLYRHLSAPLILCVEGPPGVGKTTQLAQCLRDRGSAFVRLDASRLGGELEGQPARELEDAAQALKADHREGPRPALIIDDADMGLSVHAGRNYTVNTQLTSGWLMARADRVQEPGFGPDEPAVFVTGNDFSAVHRPLLRAGRARLFEYRPTPEETEAAIAEAFAAHVEGGAEGLAREFPSATVADFLEAVSQLRDLWLECQGGAGGFTGRPAMLDREALRALLREREAGA